MLLPSIMNPSAPNRIIINTAAQYTRTAVNLILSLYSTRLILSSLGVDDYGIYTLIAGVVSILSFVVNALVVTTQRYISFYSADNNIELLKEVFNNSLLIHLFIAVISAIFIEVLGIPLFNGYFNISADRVVAAKTVYHFVTVMILLSFITSPFRALLIAHENIIYLSIIDVLDGIFKVLIAVFLSFTNGDRLILYASLLAAIQLLNFIAFFVYDRVKFQECILPSLRLFNRKYVKSIASFTGWTVYSIGCITGRTQGVSVLINRFFSVAVNAAYGIALQVNGAVMFLSQSILNAMNPQIMKNEGAGNRERMLLLSEIESKACFFLMAIFLIPLIVELPSVLRLWLGIVPDYSVMFCRGILIASLVDQLTIGLGTANQAIGNIKEYSVVVNSIKLLTLIPIIISLSLFNGGEELIMIIYVLFEAICAIARLPFLHKTAGLSIKHFITSVFAKEVIPTIVIVFCSLLFSKCFDSSWGFLFNLIFTVVLGSVAIFFTGLSRGEKQLVLSVISHHKKVINE